MIIPPCSTCGQLDRCHNCCILSSSPAWEKKILWKPVSFATSLFNQSLLTAKLYFYGEKKTPWLQFYKCTVCLPLETNTNFTSFSIEKKNCCMKQTCFFCSETSSNFSFPFPYNFLRCSRGFFLAQSSISCLSPLAKSCSRLNVEKKWFSSKLNLLLHIPFHTLLLLLCTRIGQFSSQEDLDRKCLRAWRQRVFFSTL